MKNITLIILLLLLIPVSCTGLKTTDNEQLTEDNERSAESSEQLA